MDIDEWMFRKNSETHNRIATVYDKIHPEIFNTIEQDRLRTRLEVIRQMFKDSPLAFKFHALDYGCGTGNVSIPLLEDGWKVTACDPAYHCLEVLKQKWGRNNGLRTHIVMPGQEIPANEIYDLIVLYSTLHHIPNYLDALKMLISKLKPNGIILIDHEAVESFWEKDGMFDEYYQKCFGFERKIETRTNPDQIFSEGDIHIFGNDHIEWEKVIEVVESNGCMVIESDAYLSCYGNDRIPLWEKYQDKCVNIRYLLAQKVG